MRTILLCLCLCLAATAAAQEVPFSRGFNFSAWFRVENPRQIQFNKYTRQDFVDAKRLGADVIRLPINLHGMTTGTPDHTIDPLLFTMLDQVVDWAEELDLHLILDNHGMSEAGETPPDIGDILVPVWTQVAARYQDRSTKLYYEVLNEPHGIDAGVWDAIQQRTIDAIRAVDTTHTIIVGPTGWNSFRDLERMATYADDNLIYTFHFYDPFLFTHQGATWTNPSLGPLAGVPFPFAADRMPPVPMALNTTWVAGALGSYRTVGRMEDLEELISIAVAFKEQRGVALYCGEFGVYIPNSAPADRVVWYGEVRRLLEEAGIAWTTWDYRGGFGLFEGENELFAHNLNLPLLEALGLELPPQTPFTNAPLRQGFDFYDDFAGQGVFTGTSGGQVDYYADDRPRGGDFAIGWQEAAQYNTIDFDLVPDLDLSLLVGEGYALELWIRGDAPDAALDLRFLDSHTDEEGDLPWRMRYTIGADRITWDGTWQRLRLPLRDFYEHGAWDGEWHEPRGAFDWKAVDRFQIVAEHHPLQGPLSFDEIRLVAPPSTAVALEGPVPNTLVLHPNHPNPFNPSTAVRFDLPRAADAEVAVFNTAGQRIRTLARGHRPAGTYRLAWDGRDDRGRPAASGVYLLHLRAGLRQQTRLMTLLR